MKREKQLSRRCRALNQYPVNRDGRYVICWLRVNLRGAKNPVIDAAVALANSLSLPVIVLHCISDDQPYSSSRLHTFQIQASLSLERALSSRGIAFVRSLCTAPFSEDSALKSLLADAAALILDEVSVGAGRKSADQVALATSALVVAVDGQRLVPELSFAAPLVTTPAFRAQFNAQREIWLEEQFDIEPKAGALSLCRELTMHTQVADNQEAISALVAARDIDHSLPPVTWCHGSREHALNQLTWAACEIIPHYASRRNNPATHGVTWLSPYLHYGVLCPHDIAQIALDIDASRSTWKFMDECFVWREYYHHLARQCNDPTRYNTVPLWARQTLEQHSTDQREALYSLDELIHGETCDETWNAAQRQFLVDGYMHNNLRMYWGKQIIRWTPDPMTAWYTACYLNDRLSLDGQDPATYGSIRWCFGGGRPGREAPVYGKVSRKSDVALRRRSGVTMWLKQNADRAIPRVSVPITGYEALNRVLSG